MSRARFNVIAAGPLVTLQDRGRPGFMRFGVPASGPMDRKSHAVAAAALGGLSRGPAIEVSRGGLTLECSEGRVTIAIAGGGFTVTLGAQSFGSWCVATIGEGDRVTISPGHWGSWCYIAFAGNLTADEWLGSRSTLAVNRLGGRVLAAGEGIVIEDAVVLSAGPRPLPCPIWARPRHRLRVVRGPQDRFFSEATLALLAGAPFTLTDSGDRMGVRLRGPSLPPASALSIPSEPVLRGSVQVSGDGAATILLADHQTTGGYPKIATVISDDIDGLVQCRPHERIAFQLVSPDEAIGITRVGAAQLAASLRAIERTGTHRT